MLQHDGSIRIAWQADGFEAIFVRARFRPSTELEAFAKDVADEVCFLDAGVILEQAPPAELFTSPQQPRTAQFLQRIVEAGRL